MHIMQSPCSYFTLYQEITLTKVTCTSVICRHTKFQCPTFALHCGSVGRVSEVRSSATLLRNFMQTECVLVSNGMIFVPYFRKICTFFGSRWEVESGHANKRVEICIVCLVSKGAHGLALTRFICIRPMAGSNLSRSICCGDFFAVFLILPGQCLDGIFQLATVAFFQFQLMKRL
jgi:hypothetical protein